MAEDAGPQDDYDYWDGRPHPTTPFLHGATQVVVLATLELVVRAGGGTFLLVTSPRYEPVATTIADAPVDELAQWTPPHVSRSMSDTYNFKSGKGVRQAIDKVLTGWDPEEQLAALVRTWSCGIRELREVGAFTEYKRSWSSPDGAWKVYYVLRYQADTDAIECDSAALADRAWRKGFYYLPIDDDALERSTTIRDYCPVHRRRERLYLGQPLATNLSYVVDDRRRRRELRLEPIELADGDFACEHEGLLLCGDIANYGAACEYVERMRPIDRDVDDIARFLRDFANIRFNELFLGLGIRQANTAGDGFIAARPLDPRDAGTTVELALQGFRRFIDALGELNRRMAEHFEHSRAAPGDAPPVMGTRLALHWGTWRFGKIAGPTSVAPAFDGAPVIEVARLEQGLRALVKADEAPPDGDPDLRGLPHTVIISDALVARLESADAGGALLTELGSTTARSKEYAGAAVAYRWTELAAS